MAFPQGGASSVEGSAVPGNSNSWISKKSIKFTDGGENSSGSASPKGTDDPTGEYEEQQTQVANSKKGRSDKFSTFGGVPPGPCMRRYAGSCLCTQWHSSGGNSACPLPCTSKHGLVLHPGDARRDVRNRGLCVIAVWVCSTSCAMQSESPAAAYARAYRARV